MCGIAVGSAAAQGADQNAPVDPVGRVTTLEGLGRALGACWVAPEGSTGSQITVVFSLNRAGGVIGKPRVSFSHLLGDADAQRKFVAAALESLARCTPVSMSDSLGAAVAGRPFSVRFIGGPRGSAT